MINDIETRQTLIAICETLKTQAVFFAALHRSVVAMFEALNEEFPQLRKSYNPQGVRFQELPGSAELLQQVESLLQKLQKS